MSDDEQFNQAFGEHTGISNRRRIQIDDVRQLAQVGDFYLQRSDADRFTDLAWKLLGRYIANNSHLKRLFLDECALTDQKLASLFSGLTRSVSLETMDLYHNEFGIDGVRSMIPLLQNSPNLSVLYFHGNNNINTECFAVLVQALNGRPFGGRSLEGLFINACNITDISALDTYNLLDLQQFYLGGNNIGRDGCITISNLLQLQQGSNLNDLDLDRSGVDDEGAEILVTSLENNTKLETLYLRDNDITERGYKAFLKLLVDVSSIENTYNSNHTLKELNLVYDRSNIDLLRHIKSALQLNKLHQNSSHAAGRAKVIKYQLNSNNRKELCQLQGIEFSSIGSNFAGIEPVLLPNILALIGSRHGQSEFYTALIPMVPDLMSFLDTSGMIEDLMVKNRAHDNDLVAQIAELTRQRAALSVKNDQLSRRLAAKSGAIEEGSGGTAAESGMKRQRVRKKE